MNLLVFLFIVVAVMAYLLGGINGSIIVSRYIYKKDIRNFGSGNPGLTNFYRVFGKRNALLVILIDILKNAIPFFIGKLLIGSASDYRLIGCELVGLCVMLGNAFPVYYGFRGGKGVMVMGIILFFIDWRIALTIWCTFFFILTLTRCVSISAITSVVLYPLMIGLLRLGGIWELLIAILSAALLIIRHRENIKRILNGTESKIVIRK
jgi:glycerol-3-phosphate acyltransferase PlsY